MTNLDHAPQLPPDLPSSFEALILPVDKPQGWTSFDVIRTLRRILRIRKVGHAGTLDPMATGLLVCLVGRATRLMTHFMEQPKEYTGTLRLGQSTPSFDAETPVSGDRPWNHVAWDDLARVRDAFIGSIKQETPMYSAVKVGGERLYRKARRGESVTRPPRQVEVYAFELLDWRGPDVDFLLRCSRGTYVRSIADDFGAALGCGAHLVALRRTKIGDVDVARAWSISALTEAWARAQGGDAQ